MIDVAHAINALSSSHPAEVEEAVDYLAARPDEAVPALIDALAGSSAVPAASLLGRMCAVASVDALTAAARDGGPALRWQATRALEQIRQSRM